MALLASTFALTALFKLHLNFRFAFHFFLRQKNDCILLMQEIHLLLDPSVVILIMSDLNINSLTFFYYYSDSLACM